MSTLYFCYSTDKKKDAYVNPHKHNCWELVYYKSSAGKTVIDGLEFGFCENTFALLPPRCVHDEAHTQNGRLSYIGFEAPGLKLSAGVYRDDPYQNIRHTVSRILAEGKAVLADSNELLPLLIRELTVYLNRLQDPNPIHADGLGYAKCFLDENYNLKIDLVDLAKSCGYSFDSFRYSFKKVYGLSPKSYLIELRLQKARALLENNDQSCTQIAYACGFSDSAQFSTMFRSRYGLSPKEYALQTKKEHLRPHA